MAISSTFPPLDGRRQQPVVAQHVGRLADRADDVDELGGRLVEGGSGFTISCQAP